ncbi:MAG: hypothetical protein AAFO06_22360 [Cyanobacteria bacterium J06597_16]
MLKAFSPALSAILLVSCVSPPLANPPTDSLPNPVSLPLPDVIEIPLPPDIETQVKQAYANEQPNEQPVAERQVTILRFSRETWPDSCLGLGQPAEACLFVLTEGWQVEAADATGGNSRFYRTDLTGDSVRLSTLENNLPPSVGDRILQTLRARGMAEGTELSIVSAEPQVWDSCLGVAAEDEICAQIGILGWKATATDTRSSWTYHTDGLGKAIVLHSALERLKITIPPALRPPDEATHPAS